MKPDAASAGDRFGHWAVVGTPWKDGKYIKVPLECQGGHCDRTRRVSNLDNLKSGKSTGCRKCASTKYETPHWLRERTKAMVQRCTNPNHSHYWTYGGRGIEFRFESPQAAAEWIEQNLGLYKDMEIDRIDADGHYEPGNLQWVTARENKEKARRTRHSEGVPTFYKGQQWPLSVPTVRRLMHEGLGRPAIIAHAKHVVATKSSHRWQVVEMRLRAMGELPSLTS